jgi:hypothetical protein
MSLKRIAASRDFATPDAPWGLCDHLSNERAVDELNIRFEEVFKDRLG